jgi:RNA polymerase sigma-70 factor, ECF subfamily
VDEQLLIARLRARDEGAVEELAREYSPRVYQLALRYLKNPEDAEEATQDVLLKAYQKIAHFRGDAALSSWLFRIAFNTAMSRLRHFREFEAIEDTAAVDRPDPALLADERLSRRQLRKRLARAVRELPSIYRAPIVLRDLLGMSTEEASTVLRVNDQTLKSRLHRARGMLRQRLGCEGGFEPYLVARG